MSTGVEILEFIRPEGNHRNLYITGIPWMEEEQILDKFYQLFSTYGPVYGIHLCPANIRAGHPVSEPDTTPFDQVKVRTDPNSHLTTPSTGDLEHKGFYAFVTFYLAMSAKRSKEDLKNRIVIQGQECKISYAKRKKEVNHATLHFTKCQELANYYIGFNGWSTTVKLLECDSETQEDDLKKLRYVCVVRLNIIGHGLHTEGLGAWDEAYLIKDPPSRAKAVCKSKKLSYQRAVEDAFSRVLIIVLTNGKITIEIDTTRPDATLAEKQRKDDPVLKVNEVDIEPAEDEDASLGDMEDIDAVNLHILHQLEEEM